MLEITFAQLTVLIILAWITFRTVHAFHKHNFKIAREAQLLLVLTCIIVIARIVFFPWHHIDDLILNTIGVTIGAFIYFGIVKWNSFRKHP